MSCCKKKCDRECDEKVHTYENGQVAEASSVLAFRGSDRHGNPRDVKPNPNSIAHSDENGECKMRDGSDSEPITLRLPKLSGNRVIIGVESGDGLITKLGFVEPTDGSDWFFMSIGGELTFVRNPTIRNSFKSDTIGASKAGRIALLDCGPDNTMILAAMQACEKKDFILIDDEGNASCGGACDLFEEHDADDGVESIWGCLSGEYKKLTAVEGKQLIIKDGKFKVGDAEGLNILASRKHIATLVYGDGFNLPDEDNVSASSGSPAGTVMLTSIGLPEKAKGVIVRGVVQIGIPLQPATIRASVKVNGVPIANAWALQGSGGANAVQCECHIPVTNGQFTYELVATSDASINKAALAKLDVVGSY